VARLPYVPQSDDTNECYWSNGGRYVYDVAGYLPAPLQADLTPNAIGLTCLFPPRPKETSQACRANP